MRKGRDGEKNGKKREKKEKMNENSGHYVIASSRPPERRTPERRTLERHTLVPKILMALSYFFAHLLMMIKNLT